MFSLIPALVTTLVAAPQLDTKTHQAQAANLQNNWTFLDPGQVKGTPETLVFLVGVKGNYGVWLTAGKWAIYTEDRTPIPVGTSFSYIATSSSTNAFVHVASSANTKGSRTTLNHPSLNGKSGATLTVTHNYSAPGGSQVYVNAAVRAEYQSGQWTLVTVDGSALPPGAAFNVLVGAGQASPLPIEIKIPIKDLPLLNPLDLKPGLVGWTKTGTAFNTQPTQGDNVNASRLGIARLGGDYWQLPFPIGNKGQAWIGTFENHPDENAPLGVTQGDSPQGTATSPAFTVSKPFLSFLIGGGQDRANLNVQVQVEENGNWVDQPNLIATGINHEFLRRHAFDLSALKGKRARVILRDLSSAAWGHLSVADFRFEDQNPLTDPAKVTFAAPPGANGPLIAQDADAPVFGVADLHAHPAAQIGFGGKMYQGDPTRPITEFGFCTDGHEKDPKYLHAGPPPRITEDFRDFGLVLGGVVLSPVALALAPILLPFALTADLGILRGNVFELGTGAIHSGVGYPAFQNYKYYNMLHHHMHEQWIRRAYDGGLRLMVAHPVHNSLLGNLAPKFDGQSLDDKSVGDRQLNYIKTVLVPRNSAWMEIAYTPTDARRIIRQGKLAIILGMELDTLGNLAQNSGATPDTYNREVQRLFDQGVRHLFPVHFADNAFGGSAVSGNLFNMNNFFFNKKFMDVVDGGGLGLALKLDAFAAPSILHNKIALNDGGVIDAQELIRGFDRVRAGYNTPNGHQNALGITTIGQQGLEKMMSLGLIVDIDHMSQRLRDAVLSACEARSVNGVQGYPVVAGHTAFRELSFSRAETRDEHLHSMEADQSRSNVERISRLGGMVSVIMTQKNVKPAPGSGVPANAPGTAKATAQLLHFASSNSGAGRGIGIGTDLAMLGGFGPRFGVDALPLEVAGEGMPPLIAGASEAERRATQARRTQLAFQERDGVLYDQPVLDHYRWRYFYSRDYRHYDLSAIHTARQRDFLEALAIQSAGLTGETANQPDELHGRARVTIDTINAFSKGLRELREDQVRGYGILQTFRKEMRAAYFCRFPGIQNEPADVVAIYKEIEPVWNSWKAMQTNAAHPTPLKKLVYSGTVDGKPYRRDFDINLDGFAHYGMLPDALQDLTNVGLATPTRRAVFNGAEQYIQTWEKAWKMRRTP